MNGPRDLPLWGIPFAVKDNIDVAGLETTAACPAFAYRPQKSAVVVQKLMPMNNATGITPQERQLVASWYLAGAKVEP